MRLEKIEYTMNTQSDVVLKKVAKGWLVYLKGMIGNNVNMLLRVETYIKLRVVQGSSH